MSVSLSSSNRSRCSTLAGGASSGAEMGRGLCAGLVIAGRYELCGLLGAGGMGLVYEASHLTLGSQVAIKVLRPELLEQPELVNRFIEEGHYLARLSSEHVVRIMDAGRLESGLPFLAMERLVGMSLSALLEACRRLSVAGSVDYALQICAGLADVHAAGLVHLDIKPGNLFVSPQLKILDFGIARPLGGAPSVRRVVAMDNPIGSPRYASPEQIDDPDAIDARSDIWSLGVVLFEMLGGKAPFGGQDANEVFARVMLGPTPSLRALRPTLDPRLAAVVERCLRRKPDDRFTSARALAAALQPFGSVAVSGRAPPLALQRKLNDPTGSLERSARRGRPWSRLAHAAQQVMPSIRGSLTTLDCL